ncbi:MAG: HNH endonuclease [Anaerolineae bacterium]|nr:HNH endonuclease [Anaerolineae bacterium]
MAISVEIRNNVRQQYNFACGYCGVSEISIGSELEIDHFQPVSRGGTDAPQSLVYACTTCNRFKGNYWPAQITPESLYLLHLLQDNLSHHIQETTDGRLIGLTSRGWFHIHWLHLNRPQLVAFRQWKQNETRLQEAIHQAEVVNAELQVRVRELQAEIILLRGIIARFNL